MPIFVPKPITWVALRGVPIPPLSFWSSSSSSRLKCLTLSDSPNGLPTSHKSSSPTGIFGFYLTTFDGARTHGVRWDPNETSFFTKLVIKTYEHDISVSGYWEQLDRVFDRAKAYLIPRLVGALGFDGRSVKPCLIHGDILEESIGTGFGTGDPWLFNGAVYFAHNELDLGISHQRAIAFTKKSITKSTGDGCRQVSLLINGMIGFAFIS